MSPQTKTTAATESCSGGQSSAPPATPRCQTNSSSVSLLGMRRGSLHAGKMTYMLYLSIIFFGDYKIHLKWLFKLLYRNTSKYIFLFELVKRQTFLEIMLQCLKMAQTTLYDLG